jgi:hypothetical protein
MTSAYFVIYHHSHQCRTIFAAEVGYVYLDLLILVYTEFYNSSANFHLFISINYVFNNTFIFIVSLFWFYLSICYLDISEATISYNLNTMSNIADVYQRAPVLNQLYKLNN